MPIDRTVTLVNWLAAPHNREGFRRVREIVPTARIARDEREPSPLPADPLDLDRLAVAAPDGSASTLSEQLEQTYSDGFLALSRGRVIYERYWNGLGPRDPHLLMSVSKSFCGALAGVLAGQGLLAPDDLVTDLVPDLLGTSFEGATLRHVIDMRAGTYCPEDYDAYATPDAAEPLLDYERQAGYRPLAGAEPIGILRHLRGLENAGPHGGPFEYRSVLTNVVARACESVADTPYPELLARELWAPLGPEHDAEIMLDAYRFPAAEGGMCATLRDLARLGLAYLRDGRVGEAQLIPAAWVQDTRRGDADTHAAFATAAYAELFPAGLYRNGWWVFSPDRCFAALGIHGQAILVDRERDLVVARLATEPEAVHDQRLRGLLRAAEAIAGADR